MRHLLEAAAFLLPTITSRFFDGAAFISPFPPLIQQTFTIMKQDRAHGDKTTNKPILGFCAFIFRDVFCSPNAPLSDKVNVNQNLKETPWRTPASRTTIIMTFRKTSAVLKQLNHLKGSTPPSSVVPEDSHICLCARCDVTAICFEPLQPMFAVVKMWYMTAASI